MTRILGLDDGEELVCWLPVSYGGSMGVNLRTSWSPLGARQRIKAFHAWADGAAAAGFPVVGPDMIVGVTPARVLVWKPRLLVARPGRFAGGVARRDVAQAAFTRHGLTCRLSLVFSNGAIVSVESMRAARLARIAAAITAPDSAPSG